MAVAAVAAFGAFGKTYYVDCNAEAGGDGSEKAPFKHPQLAINAADGVEPTEIIVNDGTYPVFTAADWKAVGVDPAPGDLTEDPLFAEEPPYSLQKGSPCINKGVKLEWMTADSRDLYGNPRKVSHPDLGCCESDVKPGLLLLVE